MALCHTAKIKHAISLRGANTRAICGQFCFILLLSSLMGVQSVSADPVSHRTSGDRTRMSQVTCTWSGITWSVGGSCSTECDGVSCKKNVCKSDGTWEYVELCQRPACPNKCEDNSPTN